MAMLLRLQTTSHIVQTGTYLLVMATTGGSLSMALQALLYIHVYAKSMRGTMAILTHGDMHIPIEPTITLLVCALHSSTALKVPSVNVAV